MCQASIHSDNIIEAYILQNIYKHKINGLVHEAEISDLHLTSNYARLCTL